MRERAAVDEQLDDEKQDQNLAFRRLDPVDSVVVTCPRKNTRENLVWNLDDDISDDESSP
jgi:hypothetical protein